MADYSKAKIYQILNHIDDDIYVGSTIEPLSVRMGKHRSDVARHTSPLYQKMNHLGKEHFYIELVEEYPCNNRTELLAREGFYIRERGTINKQIAGRNKKDWYEENKGRVAELGHQYRKENREKRLNQKREYYHRTKEQNKEKLKEYRETHKEKQSEYHKKYREQNKELLEEKRLIRIERQGLRNYEPCEVCGEMVQLISKKTHQKSKKCQALSLKIKKDV